MPKLKRGKYRGVFCSLIDDPDFQHLSAHARLTLLVARLCEDAGPSALFRYYPDKLAEQTGLSREDLLAAVAELKAADWVEEDGVLLWIVNGLRFDPHMRLSNDKHRESIEKHLLQLPKRELVLTFCDYYEVVYPFDRVATFGPQGVGSREDGRRSTEKGGGNRDSDSASESGPEDRSDTFKAYSAAYQRRYGVPATQNRTVRAQIKAFVARVGRHDAPHIAAYYVESNSGRYVAAGHQVGFLLRDAEKLRTEWLTQTRITATEARHADEHEQRRSIGLRLLRKAEAQHQEDPRAPGDREGSLRHAGANGHHAERNGHGGYGGDVESIRDAARAGRAHALSDRTPPPDAAG
jgi:hypothetical protein